MEAYRKVGRPYLLNLFTNERDIRLTRWIGYDEGGFSANVGLKSFKQDYNLIPENWENDESGLANRKANISSFMVLGSAFGAIIAVLGNDRLGRLRSWQIAVITYMIGTFIQIFSSGIYGLILFARIFGGLGSGALTVIAPLYLSEIAPARTRGLVVSTYMVVLLTTLALGTDPMEATTCRGWQG